ncbi:MAG: hypothetical protein FWF12_05395, partial [Betaproteobacteria bacterium]|nr:hypothetical protein [Betaproteobacteria bacterium]
MPLELEKPDRSGACCAGCWYQNRSVMPMQTYSFLSKSAADFLLRRGRFRSGLSTGARAILSTG